MDDYNTKIETRLNESQIEYKIFLFTNENEDIHKFYQEIIEYIEQLSQHYIWNNEKFQLKKPIESNNNNCYLSYGCIDFGDNLEDEWFIVYILYKLTSKFSNKLVAQTKDQDGDFLLIHAANHLPDWASSAADDCMNNRVFIYNGKLHMIPPATNPSQITYLPAAGPISNSFAGAKIIFDFSNLTEAIDDVQKSIQKRISLFESDKINLIYHKASCTIPAKLTWLLKNNPSLISAAINRFCDKDPKDLKLCRTLETFKPIDLVNYRVTFTKHLYGKLKYCDFKPEKRHQWPSINKLIDSNDVTVSLNTNNNSSSVIRERSNLGFKLTCAFEILFKRLLNDNNTNKSFDNYVKRLKNLGYFKDYIENSKTYNDLMEKARQSYSNTHHLTTPTLNKNEQTTKSMSSSDEKPPSIQSDSLASITTSDYEPVEAPTKSTSTDLLDSYSNLLDSFYLDKLISEDYVVKLKEEICMNQEKDDSDDWLCVEAPQLDDYLDMYSRGEVSSTYDFRIISNAFKKFLLSPKTKSDLLEGTDYKSIEKNDEKLIDINVDSIQSTLKNILLKNNNSKNAKINHNDQEIINEDEDGDDENDSFYEIEEDLLDNDEEVTGEKELSDNLKNYMDLMDLELKEQKNLSRIVDTSSSTVTTGSTKDNQNNNNKDDLDIDLNLVTNALESYSSQLGLSGPVSNILKSIGL
jgi:hypothetical protein